jgi:cobalamin synthase
LIVALLMTLISRRMIGGMTGDTLGAAGELAETAYLLTAAGTMTHFSIGLAA